MATLNGTIQRPDGTPVTGWVRFSAISETVVRSSIVACSYPVDVEIAEDGTFTVGLAAPGKYWVVLAGIHPFMIYLAADEQDYNLESVIVWPVTSSDANVTVWLYNPDDGNYYRLCGSGTGQTLGIVIDPAGSADPNGVRLENIWIKSETDSLYYDVTIGGTGAEMAIKIDPSGSTNPSGTKTTALSVPSLDGNWLNSVTCSGTGLDVGLVIR